MKTLFLAIIPFFLLFSFAPTPSSSLSSSLSSAITDDPVVDINDDLLRNQQCQSSCKRWDRVTDHKGDVLELDKHYYYILNTKDNRGLKPSPSRQHRTCPPIVIPADCHKKDGMALNLSRKSNSGFCNLRIEFVDLLKECPGKTVWKEALNKDERTHERYIELNDSDDSTTWFQFVGVGTNTYSIVYFKNNNCFNVSYYYENGKPQFLVLSNTLQPLVVKFMKDEDATEKPLNPDRSNISTEMPAVLAVA